MLPGLSCAALAGARPGPITLSALHQDVISAASSAYEAAGAKTYTVPAPSPRTLRLNLSVTPSAMTARYRKNLAASVVITDGATVSIAHGDTLWFGFEGADTVDDSTVVTITDVLLDRVVDSLGLVKITI